MIKLSFEILEDLEIEIFAQKVCSDQCNDLFLSLKTSRSEFEIEKLDDEIWPEFVYYEKKENRFCAFKHVAFIEFLEMLFISYARMERQDAQVRIVQIIEEIEAAGIFSSEIDFRNLWFGMFFSGFLGFKRLILDFFMSCQTGTFFLGIANMDDWEKLEEDVLSCLPSESWTCTTVYEISLDSIEQVAKLLLKMNPDHTYLDRRVKMFMNRDCLDFLLTAEAS